MQSQKLSIPAAIVAAGIIIAGAIFLSRGGTTSSLKSPGAAAPVTKAFDIPPVSPTDHLSGNPDAPIKFVEYADLECPACQFFNSVMKQAMDSYGKDGKVAWVYRHFPLKTIHSRSPHEAEATECANEIGGNTKFWAYEDRLFAVTPANNGLDPAQLPKIATDVGLDKTKFNACLDSGKYAPVIEQYYNDAVKMGLESTPTSYLLLSKPLSAESVQAIQQKTVAYTDQYGQPLVIVGSDSKTIEIAAAFRFEALKTIIDTVLVELGK